MPLGVDCYSEGAGCGEAAGNFRLSLLAALIPDVSGDAFPQVYRRGARPQSVASSPQLPASGAPYRGVGRRCRWSRARRLPGDMEAGEVAGAGERTQGRRHLVCAGSTPMVSSIV